jgi:16S rRNA (cytosine1402-N4)-methyltransferase
MDREHRLAHKPVLFNEVMHALEPRSAGIYVDGTVGAGGHARGILEACKPGGRLLGLDVDQQALALAREHLAPYGERLILKQASYDTILDAMHENGWQAVDGIVLDLGVSSMQLQARDRGFSFRSEAPLDMRFDQRAPVSAAQLVNTASEADLADIIFKFGEEPRARRIARMIVAARPVKSTTELANLVRRAYRGRVRMHPATRTFQALRIAVNDELACLERALPRALQALRLGARLAVISFHSLEDRIVKHFFREQSRAHINPPYTGLYARERRATLRELSRKPITPGDAEVSINPRARSARLRIAERI